MKLKAMQIIINEIEDTELSIKNAESQNEKDMNDMV